MRNANFAIFLGAILSIPFMLHSPTLGMIVWVAVIFIQPYLASRLAARRNPPSRDH